MNCEHHRVIQDPAYGYRRLDPIPGEDEIGEFYQSCYYELIRKGRRAPPLRHLTAGGEEAEREREWLGATLYSDILDLLTEYAAGQSILDVGCGTGEFLSYLKVKGFKPVGVEPSSDAATIATSRGLTVHDSTMERFVEIQRSNNTEPFGAVVLLNVLEHVPNPVELIRFAKEVLIKPGGIICVRVPNKFNGLQLAAKERLNKDARWIAVPDHINYFDFQSLHALLESLNFEVIYSQGDFPMELFLLMGDDFVGNPDIGSRCHRKRVSFEMAIPHGLRRRLYQALATIGLGRNCLLAGRLRE